MNKTRKPLGTDYVIDIDSGKGVTKTTLTRPQPVPVSTPHPIKNI